MARVHAIEIFIDHRRNVISSSQLKIKASTILRISLVSSPRDTHSYPSPFSSREGERPRLQTSGGCKVFDLKRKLARKKTDPHCLHRSLRRSGYSQRTLALQESKEKLAFGFRLQTPRCNSSHGYSSET